MLDQTQRPSAMNLAALGAPRVLALPDLWSWVALAAALLTYIPTYLKLYAGPWQTEQEGHGPLIMLAAAWLAWRQRDAFQATPIRPAYAAGWSLLILGLAAMVIGRSQDLLFAAVLLCRGWAGARSLAFPILFLVFSIPPPGWMLDALTVPLKGWVSDVVAQTLYSFGYPIAQNGVILMVGPYELMVKDACSGMNSIFALSAIGVFYIHEFVQKAPVRTAILIAGILPITIAANLVRVASLVLMAYYAGADAVVVGTALTGIESRVRDFAGPLEKVDSPKD